MALDAIFIQLLKEEYKEQLLGARVDRIHQISKEELLLSLRSFGKSYKLFLSCRAGSTRVHITKQSFENPQKPPMFCMLLRKYLNSAKLVDITGSQGERIMNLEFDSINEIGNTQRIVLACEMMGRHSNIIVLKDGKVVDSIKRVNSEMSSVRPILPGIAYELPPKQEKVFFLDWEPRKLAETLGVSEGDKSKAAMKLVGGISPIVARELVLEEDVQAMEGKIAKLQKIVKDNLGIPTVVYDTEEIPLDFSFFSFKQYGPDYKQKEFPNYSELLDHFYSKKDSLLRTKQRSSDLLKTLSNTIKRTQHKMKLQQEELFACQNREELRTKADLLNANLYTIKKGQAFVRVQNFYSEQPEEVEIAIKPFLTPVQNVQKYYSDYKKTYTAEKKLKEQLKFSEEELTYLESVQDAIIRTNSESEIEEIRQELIAGGYLRGSKLQKKQKQKVGKPIHYRTTDGFDVYAGRNNTQNDLLTLKTAEKEDIWFHTQKIPGSHVILVTKGKEPTDLSYTQAAEIAAYHSKGQSSAQVAVDYSRVKNIKKPAGAKPGMVIYETYYTAYVTPEEEKIISLLVK